MVDEEEGGGAKERSLENEGEVVSHYLFLPGYRTGKPPQSSQSQGQVQVQVGVRVTAALFLLLRPLLDASWWSAFCLAAFVIRGLPVRSLDR